MNATATRFLKEAVYRALLTSPADVTFYRQRAEDLVLPPAYRQALREAIDEWAKTKKMLQK